MSFKTVLMKFLKNEQTAALGFTTTGSVDQDLAAQNGNRVERHVRHV